MKPAKSKTIPPLRPESEDQNTSSPSATERILIEDAVQKIDYGFKVLPCNGKEPSNKIKSVAKFRERPVHKGNADFYFSGATAIALLLGDKLEAIDVDTKND